MFIRISALCVAVALICSALRPQRPEIATGVSLAAGIAALAMLGAEAGDVSAWFGETTRLFEQGGDISLAALRGVGIAVTAELGAQLCTDAGESAMAGRITLASRVAMLSLCLPMLTELARAAEELLA